MFLAGRPAGSVFAAQTACAASCVRAGGVGHLGGRLSETSKSEPNGVCFLHSLSLLSFSFLENTGQPLSASSSRHIPLFATTMSLRLALPALRAVPRTAPKSFAPKQYHSFSTTATARTATVASAGAGAVPAMTVRQASSGGSRAGPSFSRRWGTRLGMYCDSSMFVFPVEGDKRGRGGLVTSSSEANHP